MTRGNKDDARKVEETRCVYHILQIMPAAPETFMLYKATGTLWDDPTPRPVYDTLVAGWALVEEWVVPEQSQYLNDDLPTCKPDRRTVVPLLMDSCGPRTPHGFRENDHVGFRVGKYVSGVGYNMTVGRRGDAADPSLVFVKGDLDERDWIDHGQRAVQRAILFDKFCEVLQRRGDALGIRAGENMGALLDELALIAVPEPDTTAATTTGKDENGLRRSSPSGT